MHESGSKAMRALVAVALVSAAFPLFAQQPAPAAEERKEYVPVSGQAGKDVVWVPSPVSTVEKMLDIAKVTPKDFVVDLGSGDGRNVILAAKRGARGLGVEFNPDLVALSKKNAAKEGVGKLANFVQGDMFEADFSKATVLALFLLPDNLRRLEHKFLQLKPGTRIVANTFGITDWKPEVEETIAGNCTSWCKVMLYIVPAPVAGSWSSGGQRFELSQNVQELGGAVVKDGASMPVEKGRVSGDKVSFMVAGASYSGTVKGRKITGTVERDGKKQPWTASRAS